MTMLKRNSLLSAFCILLACSGPALAYDWSRVFGAGSDINEADCQPYHSCTVAGAEVEDAATVLARAKIGTGPDVGLASDRRMKSDIKEVGTHQAVFFQVPLGRPGPDRRDRAGST
jgi:hypothetical protein